MPLNALYELVVQRFVLRRLGARKPEEAVWIPVWGPGELHQTVTAPRLRSSGGSALAQVCRPAAQGFDTHPPCSQPVPSSLPLQESSMMQMLTRHYFIVKGQRSEGVSDSTVFLYHDPRTL